MEVGRHPLTLPYLPSVIHTNRTLDVYGQWVRSTRITKLQKAGTLPVPHRSGDGGGGGGPAHVGRRNKVAKDSRSTVLISFIAAAGAPERPERSGWGVQVLYVVYCFFW